MASEVHHLTEVTEGRATILLPESVFYNPVQEYNRDLTIAIISEFAAQHLAKVSADKNVSQDTPESCTQQTETLVPGKKYDNGITIFEGLSASGLRSVRFGLEIPGIKQVIANDFDKTAVEIIEKNIQKNHLEHLVSANYADASMAMYEHKSWDKQFDVIDLDPYGSPSIFLDAAVQAVRDGGLLCITCTDAAVLCGNAPEKCNANYGSISLRSKFCHEMGLRIMLQCLDSHANRYGRYIVPLVSLSIDFYFRLFVQIFSGQKQVKHSCTKKSFVFECVGCGSYLLQPLAVALPAKGTGNYKFIAGSGPVVPQNCEHCHHHYKIGGPIWSAPLHDTDFIKKILSRIERNLHTFKTADRISGMLNVALEELADVPLFYVLDVICSVLHCRAPNMVAFRSALLNAGYRVSLSHAAKNSCKTDAPTKFVWDIMRCWVKENPVSAKRLTPGSVAKAILDQQPEVEVSFSEHPSANPLSRKQGLLRWQTNPEPHWGPKAKAKRAGNPDLIEKQAINQGKKSKVENMQPSE
ncbi:tRNA (guanine(26)-N(2))-dimethyltransferase [Biomphalaria glabrata]|nr:tRNA (guanine(26)-N(2))-dimethyltransferase-like [Biomphalaria glabrata]